MKLTTTPRRPSVMSKSEVNSTKPPVRTASSTRVMRSRIDNGSRCTWWLVNNAARCITSRKASRISRNARSGGRRTL